MFIWVFICANPKLHLDIGFPPESAVFTNEYERRTTSRPFQKGFPPHLVVSSSRWLSDVDVFDPQTIASHNLNFLLRFRFKMASLSVSDHLRHTFDTTQR